MVCFFIEPRNNNNKSILLFCLFCITSLVVVVGNKTTTTFGDNDETAYYCSQEEEETSNNIIMNPQRVAQSYKLLQKKQLSHDSYLLRYEILGRKILGLDPSIPTCIKVDYNVVDSKTGESVQKTISKSYSPVSHPKTMGTFDLIVKSYPIIQPNGIGGVGSYLCNMSIGDSIIATLKSQRIMHGSPVVEGRWNHVGLIAGGTGIAPLLQLARILLQSPSDTKTKIYLLFINKTKQDILGKDEIDSMVQKYTNQFFVTYALTTTDDDNDDDAPTANDDNDDDDDNTWYERGRGTVEMALKALPSPNEDKTMIFVCGKDGFVAHWGGPVGRGPPKPDGSKGPKIQGPLLGILKEAGYTAQQVFKY